MRNRSKTLFFGLSFILITLTIFILLNYAKTKELSTQLNNYYIEFQQTENRSKKIKIIKDLNSNEDIFTKNTKDEYDNLQEKFDKWLISDYEQTITNNSLEKLEETSDKKLINSYKDNLKDLDKKIKDENLLNSEKAQDFSNKINNLIKSYDERLNQIDEAEKKAEEERIAKEKAEAEKKAAEEAVREKEKQESAKKNNQTSNNSNKTQSSRGRMVKQTWDCDPETGEKIPGTDQFMYENGDVLDINGRFVYNVYDWFPTFDY